MSASWPIAAAHSKNIDVMIDQVCNKMSPTEVIASLDDYHPNYDQPDFHNCSASAPVTLALEQDSPRAPSRSTSSPIVQRRDSPLSVPQRV